MKVLKDNYSIINETVQKTYPKVVVCENCNSELQYDETDMHEGALGAMYVDCPLCGGETMVEEEGITLTKSNIKFPKHFFHISVHTGATDCLKHSEIKPYINQAIDYFRIYKDEYYWFTVIGNLAIFIFKMDGDEEYWVFVSGDYYDTYIPFENEDY